jgi:hypothetical protein
LTKAGVSHYSSPYARHLSMARETFLKRQKEMVRQRKKQEKEARRLERKQHKLKIGPRPDGEDPDIAGIRPGPQPKLF